MLQKSPRQLTDIGRGLWRETNTTVTDRQGISSGPPESGDARKIDNDAKYAGDIRVQIYAVDGVLSVGFMLQSPLHIAEFNEYEF